MSTPVLVVGEALIDIVIPLDGAAAEHVGGSPANVAIGLARLGHPTTFATRIGADERGQTIGSLLNAEIVTLVPGSTNAPRTSTALARLDENKIATYEFDLDWNVDPDLVAPDGGHLHTGSIAATLTPPISCICPPEATPSPPSSRTRDTTPPCPTTPTPAQP